MATSVSAVEGQNGAGAAEGAHQDPHGGTPSTAKAAALDSVLQKDAFLVFRALCKLSIKTADASSGTDVTATRGKVGAGKPAGGLRLGQLRIISRRGICVTSENP